MTPDQYVEAVLTKYQVPRGPSSAAESLVSAVASPLRSWANQYFNAMEYSGSYAKGTGVRGISDVDVFISLKSDTPGTLKELYNNLYRFAEQQTWSPRYQNVSVGVTVNETRGARPGQPGADSLSWVPPSPRKRRRKRLSS
jgi:Nucleotidyltransferase domain